MLLCSFSQCQGDKLRAIIHAQHDRIAAICLDPVEYTNHSQSRLFQFDFCRQCFTVKVINNIESVETTATDQGIMHKIDRPALVQRFRRDQWRGITHQQPLLALTEKIQLQKTVNTVDPFVIPRGSLPRQNQEEFRKTVSWVSLSHCLQRDKTGSSHFVSGR